MAAEHYVMECRVAPGSPEAMINEWPDIPGIDSWWTGARFEGEIVEPVRCVLHPRYTEGMLPVFNDEILLMTTQFFECVSRAGVDNLDCYQAVILDPNSGYEHKNYLAINVIGVVAAADFPRSSVGSGSSEKLISMDFDQLAIDVKAIHRLKMFRLAECVTALVVHKSVRREVENHPEFETVKFLDPQEWIG